MLIGYYLVHYSFTMGITQYKNATEPKKFSKNIKRVKKKTLIISKGWESIEVNIFVGISLLSKAIP